MTHTRNLILAALSAALLASPALAEQGANYLMQDATPMDVSPVNPAGLTPETAGVVTIQPMTSSIAPATVRPTPGMLGAPIVAVVAQTAPVSPSADVVIQSTPQVVAAKPPVLAPAAVQVEAPLVVPPAVQVQAPIVAPPVVVQAPIVVSATVAQAPVARPVIQAAPMIQQAPVVQTMIQQTPVVQTMIQPAPVVQSVVQQMPIVQTVVASNAMPLRVYPPAGMLLASPVVHQYAGIVYPANSMLLTSASNLRANMNGTVYVHPALPGRNLFWNRDEERWCYQDVSSSTGWRFIPGELFIPHP